MTLSTEMLDEKREQILRSRAVYQAQIAACDGALKVIEDLAAVLAATEQLTKTA